MMEEIFQSAERFYKNGKSREAQALLQQILQKNPKHSPSLNLMGILTCQSGHPENGLDWLRRAVAAEPDRAEYHFNLGMALRICGKLHEAIPEFQRAVAIEPRHADALHELGVALYNTGHALEAISTFQKLIGLRPDSAGTHFYLANMLHLSGRLAESIAAFERCIVLRPEEAEYHNNFGNVLRDAGRFDDAIASYENAIRLQPSFAVAFFNLGNVLKTKQNFDQAIQAYRRALVLEPKAAGGWGNLGNTLKDIGELDQAIQCYDGAVAAEPGNPGILSNYLYALHFHPDYDAAALFREHRQWNDRFGKPLAKTIRPHANTPQKDRRLRIGYISPNFRMHPVGRFLLPLLEKHDHSRFEIFCYSVGAAPDSVTARLRAAADIWREIHGLADEPSAQLIRSDQIDILVDLSLHMGDNCLPVFARKPAPVQVTYLAYCSTSGLDAMDFRISDPFLDPPGMDETVYSEKTIRLPHTYWCYEPAVETMPVGELPALKSGFITFACLNNFGKISGASWKAWQKILLSVPGSHLLINAPPGRHCEKIRQQFAKDGIQPARLSFVELADPKTYFQRYNGIDIALDPFPYCGGTTTCDALWMAVPVVTPHGRTAVGRGGVSILNNVGLPELIAKDEKEYVKIAIDLAGNLAKLKELRASLRDRIESSPLMDAAGFAKAMEETYRHMWHQWCENRR